MSSTHSRTEVLTALLLALLTLALRVPNLGWGLPDIDEEALPLKKALDMWGWNEGHLQLDPKTAGWPSLSFYIHLGAQHLEYFIGSMSGRYDDRFDFLVENTLDMSTLLLWARGIGVLCAGLVVFWTSRLAFRLSGLWGALLAGGTLALSPLLLRHAQLVTPDILLTLFSALALVKVMDIYERGRVQDYFWAGLLLGLGIACKYTPLLLTLGLFFVHLLRRRVEGAGLQRAGLEDRRIWIAALACLGAFVITSPYTLSDLEILRRDFSYQALHMSEGHFGQEHVGVGPIYYLSDVLGPGLGWPALILAVTGLALAAWRLGGAWRALLLYLLPFVIGIVSLNTRFDRYMLPALMPLALGLAAWPALLSERFEGMSPRMRGAAMAGLLALCLIPAAAGVAAYHREKATRSTLQVAEQWMDQTLRATNPALAMESYTPHVLGDSKEPLRKEPFFAQLSVAQQSRLMGRPGFRRDHIPMNSVRMELVAYYYDLRHYLPYDYVVTSSSVQGRYEAAPSQYPRQMKFYADLERYAVLDREFEPDTGQRGPRVRFYRWDGEAKQRLLEVQGPLPERDYLGHRDNLHPPQLFQFLTNVAKRAEQAGMWKLAAHYADALLETTARAPGWSEKRRGLLGRSAQAHVRAGQYEQVLDRVDAFMELGPPDPPVLAYRAQAQEGLGRLSEALQSYADCEAEARKFRGQERWLHWAREQRMRIERQLSGSGTKP